MKDPERHETPARRGDGRGALDLEGRSAMDEGELIDALRDH